MSFIFKWQPAATKLVTHTTKLNTGNPINLYKIEFLSPDELTVVKIKKSYLLFYKSGGGGLSPLTKKVEGLSTPSPPPPLPPPMLSETPTIVKTKKKKKEEAFR